jgi:hypothetical protein
MRFGTAEGSSAYRSSITIRLDDGTVLRDQEAHNWLRRR